jgi:hypothetical protein
MRHDKHAFAGDAIRSAAAGKAVGDLERMLLFSHYAGALPWPFEATRSCLDPFTGSFVLPLPITTALLCLTLKILGLRQGTSGQDGIDPEELLRVGARRLGSLMERFDKDPDWMRRAYATEQRAWHAYYELLDRIEEAAGRQSGEAAELTLRARSIIRETRVKT